MNYEQASKVCSWAYSGLRAIAVLLAFAVVLCVVASVVLLLGEKSRGDAGGAILGAIGCFAGLMNCWIGMAVVSACHAVLARTRSQLGVEVHDEGVPVALGGSAQMPRRAAPVRDQQPTAPVRELGRLPNESLESWAARVEQSEIAAFKARSKT